MLLKTLLILIVAYAPTMVLAEHREIKRMDAIVPYVTTDTLVVFDIDNTLIQPTQMLGSDQWFGYRVSHYRDSGFSEEEAIDRAISEWTAVQLETRVKAVEATVPALFQRFRNKHIRMMALTARPLELVEASHRQLHSMGIDFVDTLGIGTREITVDDAHTSRYVNGILLVGPKNNKGKVLDAFLKSEGLQPRSLVFIDDKARHVTNVGEALKYRDITYTGFRYGASDAYVAQFDQRIVDIQYDVFLRSGKFISDAAARRCLSLDSDCK